MKNYIATALVSNYGFEVIRNSILFAGRGSWGSAGQTIEITFNGDLAHINHLSQVWGFLPEWVLTR